MIELCLCTCFCIFLGFGIWSTMFNIQYDRIEAENRRHEKEALERHREEVKLLEQKRGFALEAYRKAKADYEDALDVFDQEQSRSARIQVLKKGRLLIKASNKVRGVDGVDVFSETALQNDLQAYSPETDNKV